MLFIEASRILLNILSLIAPLVSGVLQSRGLVSHSKIISQALLTLNLSFWHKKLVLVCSKMVNHGLFSLLLKFFGWKCILNWLEKFRLKIKIVIILKELRITWCTGKSARKQLICIDPKNCFEQLLFSVYRTWDI